MTDEQPTEWTETYRPKGSFRYRDQDVWKHLNGLPGRQRSAFINDALHYYYTVVVHRANEPPPQLKAIRRDLQGVATNINQIARKLNRTDDLERSDPFDVLSSAANVIQDDLVPRIINATTYWTR